MASSAFTAAESAFEALVNSEDVDVVDEDGECQVIADDWTLVLAGDPVSSVLIALDDESGEPEAALRAAIAPVQLGALRELDAQMHGDVSRLLGESPDELARALAALIVD